MKNYLLIATCLSISLCLFAGSASSEVYQFYDSEGTLIVTNRKGDLPLDGAYRVLSSRRAKPTGRKPLHALPSTVRIVSRPAPEFIADRGVEGVRFKYYEVCGPTAREALHQSAQRGPYDRREGRSYPGQTKWSLGWRYDVSYDVNPDSGSGGVSARAEVYNVQIYADVEVLLPRLSTDCAMPRHEMEIWNRSMDSLRRHELDHVNIVTNENALQAMAESIAGERDYSFPFSGGGGIDKALGSAVQADTHSDGLPWIRWIRDLNDEYDRVTDHGLKPEKRNDFFNNL